MREVKHPLEYITWLEDGSWTIPWLRFGTTTPEKLRKLATAKRRYETRLDREAVMIEAAARDLEAGTTVAGFFAPENLPPLPWH